MRRSIAARSSPWAPDVKLASATSASLTPLTVRSREATTGTSTFARLMGCWKRRLPRTIVSVMPVPGLPWMSDVE